MKKLLMAFSAMLFIVLLGISEPIGLGNRLLRKNDGTSVTGDTLAPGDTIKTMTYNLVEGMSEYLSLAVGLDSVKDSTYCRIELVESWDVGVSWEFITTVGTITTAIADIDTVLEVNLFPAPYFAFWIINLGTTSDSFNIEHLKLYVDKD